MSEYDGKQFVGIDLHRRHSVIVRQTSTGERLSAVRIVNDPDSLALQLEEAGEHPEVVLEATYGWYWAVDALQAAGATVHLTTEFTHRSPAAPSLRRAGPRSRPFVLATLRALRLDRRPSPGAARTEAENDENTSANSP